jgi:hypothetical protein
MDTASGPHNGDDEADDDDTDVRPRSTRAHVAMTASSVDIECDEDRCDDDCTTPTLFRNTRSTHSSTRRVGSDRIGSYRTQTKTSKLRTGRRLRCDVPMADAAAAAAAVVDADFIVDVAAADEHLVGEAADAVDADRRRTGAYGRVN